MNFEGLYKENNFTDEEKKFITLLYNQHDTGPNNQSRVILEFILGKKIEKSVDKLITVEEKLAASNIKHSKSMNYLTGALVFIGLIQIIIQLFKN